MSSFDSIPIVDFSCMSLDTTTTTRNNGAFHQLAQEIHTAFSTVGFVYLKNTGISDAKVQRLVDEVSVFFALPSNVKRQYSRNNEDNHGYVSLEMERLNPTRPGDFKEAFNVTPNPKEFWPDEHVPGMKSVVYDFFSQCQDLSDRVLQAMAVGLGLEENYFTNCHRRNVVNKTTLRCLSYPPIPPDIEIKENQVRCGEHSDYGSITLLFQDDVGGLEVCNRDGVYVPATPIPETVLVNIGDLMQRWTADSLLSTKHRVLLPNDAAARNTLRHSFAFFVHPDDDCMIRCTDGSEKYEPMTALDYLKSRFSETY